MEGMLELWRICRPVTEDIAYTSPYLYAASKYQLSHIRVISAGEIQVRYKGSPLPVHVLNFIQSHGEVMVFANIVRKYLVQLIIRGIKTKGFTLFAPTSIPFYGLGRLRQNFRYGDPVLLVEGVLDVESSKRYFTDTLGVLTASLSTFQTDLLETLTNNVVLGFDNDESGIRGSKRAYYKLKEKGFSLNYLQYPPSLKDTGDLIKMEMNGELYELQFAETLMKAQILQKTGSFR